MAFPLIAPGSTTAALPMPGAAERWLGYAVRAMLLVNLAAMVALHVMTVPTIFATLQSACVPGACFSGQLNAEAFAWLANRGISATLYAAVITFLAVLIPAVGSALAAVTIWQRPTAWMPVLFIVAIATCSIGASGALAVVTAEHPEWTGPALLLDVPMIFTWPLLPALFPDGRFVPRWSAVVIPLALLDVATLFQPDLSARLPGWLQDARGWTWILSVLIFIPWRLHVTADKGTMRQTRIWLAALAPLWVLAVVEAVMPETIHAVLGSGDLAVIAYQVGWSLSVLVLLAGFMLAIYLYHLYDVSVVLRRSLVYGILTVALVGVYLLVVGVVGVFTRGGNAAAPTVLATAAIALLFAPLRDWLQRIIRRLLFGEDDPYGVISRFGRRLEEEPAADRLLRSIVELAQDSLRSPGVSLSVAGSSSLSVQAGAVPVSGVTAPVRYQGEQVGVLAVAPRAPGERFSIADLRLIDEIARQMGIAVNSVLQAEDLRRSRERLVSTREEERRRIRRDLHDGLGPSLAALSLQVEIARDLIATDPDRSTELLDVVLTQTREAIADVRRLVYGLRPPALDDLGLLGAIRAQRAAWEQHGLEIALHLPASLPPLPAATEVAIYRIVQEAMNNVIRHAGATASSICIGLIAGEIAVTVADNGRGLPVNVTPGVGLLSIRERVAEIGGRCVIDAGAMGGVTVEARFALPVETWDGADG